MDNYILSDDVSRYTVFTNDTNLLRQKYFYFKNLFFLANILELLFLYHVM